LSYASTGLPRSAIGGFWRSLQQQLGKVLGGVGEVEALARRSRTVERGTLG